MFWVACAGVNKPSRCSRSHLTPLQQHTLDPTTFSSINVVQFRQISNTLDLSHEPFNLLQILVMAATTTKTATPKAANGAGVKKAGAPKGGRVGKKNNARNAMAKMQAYCKFTTFDALRRVVASYRRDCRNVGTRGFAARGHGLY